MRAHDRVQNEFVLVEGCGVVVVVQGGIYVPVAGWAAGVDLRLAQHDLVLARFAGGGALLVVFEDGAGLCVEVGQGVDEGSAGVARCHLENRQVAGLSVQRVRGLVSELVPVLGGTALVFVAECILLFYFNFNFVFQLHHEIINLPFFSSNLIVFLKLYNLVVFRNLYTKIMARVLAERRSLLRKRAEVVLVPADGLRRAPTLLVIVELKFGGVERVAVGGR